MPQSAELGIFVHILGVFGVAGASTTFILVLSMMRRAKTVQEVRLWSNLGTLAEHAYPFAALVLVLSGAYVIEDLDFSWGDGWINTSLIALALMTVAVLKVNTLKMNAIHHAAEDAPEGPLPPALAAQVTDPMLLAVTHVITVGQLGVAWNMTTKPGDAEAGIVILLAAAIGALSVVPAIRRQQAIEHAE